MKKAIVIAIVAVIATVVTYSISHTKKKNDELTDKYDRLIKDVVASDGCSE